MTYTLDRRYIHIVNVSFRLYIRKKKFTILKIRHITVRSSLRHKQCDVIDDLRIPHLREHGISNKGNNTLLPQLSQTYFL